MTPLAPDILRHQSQGCSSQDKQLSSQGGFHHDILQTGDIGQD